MSVHPSLLLRPRTVVKVSQPLLRYSHGRLPRLGESVVIIIRRPLFAVLLLLLRSMAAARITFMRRRSLRNGRDDVPSRSLRGPVIGDTWNPRWPTARRSPYWATPSWRRRAVVARQRAAGALTSRGMLGVCALTSRPQMEFRKY